MKSESSKPSRNNLVDIIRGLAMLMVILQHTISGSATEYQDTFLFKMIWSLQMPLFFIISGYVTRYSKPLTTAGALWRFVKKRSLAYLLPWLVWTIIVRGFIFQQSNMLDFKYLLWHMDAGYWFLVSLWTIALIFGFANCLAFKINLSSKLFSSLCQLLFVGFGALILMLIGYFAGFEFLDIKLTLFYIPLYACGFIFGQFQDEITKGRNQAILSWTYILCTGIWLYVITRYEIFGVEPTPLAIATRYIAALTGCVAVAAILNECNSLRGGVLQKAGALSLEIYVVHYLFLNLLTMSPKMELASTLGFINVAVNYAVTVSLTMLTIYLTRKNQVLQKLLYYR